MSDVVIVTYHLEPEGFWAEVDALPTFSAAAPTFEELRDRVFAALADLLPSADIREDIPGHRTPVILRQTPSELPWVTSWADGQTITQSQLGVPA
jgi:predicted RNase H-like HicB family nuclease